MTDVMTSAPPEPPQAPPPTGAYTPAPTPRGGGGATAGIVLIVVGALFLFGRFVPAFSWWTLWPLVLVIAGLVQAFTPGKDGWNVAKMFDGFVTVAFGGVFFAITTGLVGWGVWSRIVMFWPVLVIAVGLDILGKALHTSWPKVLGSLAIIAALGFSVATATAGSEVSFLPTRSDSIPYTLRAPVGAVQDAKLTLDAGVAQVRIASGSDLVGVDGRSPFGTPKLEVGGSSTSVDVALKLAGGDQMMIWPGDFSANYDVGLSDKVVWDLRMNTGVADLEADLSQIPVSRLDLRPGVASCDVKLGNVPDGTREARAEVKAGISSVAIHVPSGVEARVEIESGLSGNSVRGDFSKRGAGVWETPGFAEAQAAGDPVWILSVKSGIGSISIDTY